MTATMVLQFPNWVHCTKMHETYFLFYSEPNNIIPYIAFWNSKYGLHKVKNIFKCLTETLFYISNFDTASFLKGHPNVTNYI
jgi:hypothetical protein